MSGVSQGGGERRETAVAKVSQGGGERRETEVSEVSQGGWETEMSQGGGEDQNTSPVRTSCGRRRRRAISSTGTVEFGLKKGPRVGTSRLVETDHCTT